MRSTLEKLTTTVATGDGAQLVCTIAGHGESVLLVSGAHPAQAWHAVTVPALVAAGYRVVTYDHRGIPPSSVTEPPYSVDKLTTDLFAVVDALKLDPCHIVSTSVGGIIAQAAVLARPAVFRSASFLPGTGDCAARPCLSDDSPAMHVLEFPEVRPARRPRLLARDVIGATTTGHERITIADSMMGALRPPTCPGRGGTEWQRPTFVPRLDAVQRLELPTLVVAGQGNSPAPMPGTATTPRDDPSGVSAVLVDFLGHTRNLAG